jgi:hypothetical protein
LGDTNTEVNSDSFNPFAFRNERPPSVLGPEREIYEELCRGDLTDETNVFFFNFYLLWFLILNNLDFLFYNKY